MSVTVDGFGRLKATILVSVAKNPTVTGDRVVITILATVIALNLTCCRHTQSHRDAGGPHHNLV